MTAKTATLRQLWQRVNHDDPHAFLAFIVMLLATTINGEVPSTDDLNRYLDRFIQEHGEPTIEDIETILDGFSGIPVTKGLCDHVGFTVAAREDRN